MAHDTASISQLEEVKNLIPDFNKVDSGLS